MTAPDYTGWKRGDPIGYIRQDIPDFDVPAYEGERYSALVPDTLDLQQRAEWSVSGLTGITDPDADYEVYFRVRCNQSPAMMQHDYSDVAIQVKFMEALPLMRIISGSTENIEVDRRWMEMGLRWIGPDGAPYMPLVGRPWALINAAWWDIEPQGDFYISPFPGGRLLSSVVLYARRSRDPRLLREAERVVDALTDLAVDRGSFAYFSPSAHQAIKGRTSDPRHQYKHRGANVNFITLSLAHLYRESGYEPAATLANKLIRYTLDEIQYFGEDGSFVADHKLAGSPWAHFHMHTYTLLAMLEHARLTDDADLLEKVRLGYEYGKSQGNTLLGYFPEYLNSEQQEESELCEVADMIALAFKLTDAGVGDYIDDADRWIRNMFAEGQLTPERRYWLERYTDPSASTHRESTALGRIAGSAIDPMYQTNDRVIERNVGNFAGWPLANDWGVEIQHCCTGNASRTIYFIWDHILGYSSGKLRVDLLLNRASPWADIDSHIPYTGRVDIRVKTPCDLSVRIPEWVSPSETRCEVSGTARETGFNGRYANVGAVKPGDVVTLTFPISERTEEVWIEKRRYTVVIKGNEVVRIDPPGSVCPIYQREHYRNNTPLRPEYRSVEGDGLTIG